MGLLTLCVPSDQIRFADEGSFRLRLLPVTVTVKDFFSFTILKDRTLGVTLMLSLDPLFKTIFDLYVEFGLPRLVTVLLKATVKELLDFESLADIEG